MVMYFMGDVTMKGHDALGCATVGQPVLLAIPLFVLAGTVMSESGIAASSTSLCERLYWPCAWRSWVLLRRCPVR